MGVGVGVGVSLSICFIYIYIYMCVYQKVIALIFLIYEGLVVDVGDWEGGREGYYVSHP